MPSRFPDILLSDVLDFLPLEVMLTSAMPVCRDWREQVVEHRRYWRHITLLDGCYYPNPAACSQSAALFNLRISRSRNRPTRISVIWDDPSAVLDAIVLHLSHIRRMSFVTDLARASEVLEALGRATAPELEFLALNFSLGGQSHQAAAVIPRDLLGGQAPVLRALSLTNVGLPLDSADFPRCLSSLESLSYSCFTLSRSMPLPNVFASCPQLSALLIQGDVTLAGESFLQDASWKGLSQFTIQGPRPQGWDILEVPLQHVPYIALNKGGSDSVVALAQPLGQRLAVTFAWQQTPGGQRVSELRAELRDEGVASDSERRRELGMGVPDQAPFFDDTIRGFQHASVAGRIVRLTLALLNWEDLVGQGYLARLPALETLILTLFWWPETPVWPSPAPSGKLSCPRLSRLILQRHVWSLAVVVDARDALQFGSSALQDAPLPVVLELDDVELAGSVSQSGHLFRLGVAERNHPDMHTPA